MTTDVRAEIARAERALHSLGVEPEANPYLVRGYAVKWDSIAHGQKGATRFAPSAFGSSPIKVPLLWAHDEARPIGHAVLTPDSAGLRAEARIAPTSLGADAIALLRDGAVNGLSIGFNVNRSQPQGGVRLVTSAELSELSIVVFPADAAARVDSVGGEPIYHAAAPRERETAAAGNVMDEVRRAERELRRINGEPEPAIERQDVCGRVLSQEALAAQRRGRALLDSYEVNGCSPWLRALASSRPIGR